MSGKSVALCPPTVDDGITEEEKEAVGVVSNGLSDIWLGCQDSNLD